ncbi:MAG: methyltransferase domain-containing protein [Candidatus Aenigmatarchaeota archaeon]
MCILFDNTKLKMIIPENIRKIYTLWYSERRKKAIEKFMNNVTGEKILDIGSGKGIFNKIFRKVGFKKIFAVDFNRKLLKMNDADKRFILNLENKLPFSNNSFDCCFAAEILEHLENREQLLNEIHRILKKGGYLILTTPNKDSLIAKFDRIIGRFIVDGLWNGHDYSHKYVYSFNEIVKLIKEVGFKILKLESFYLFYRFPILTKSSSGMCTWILAQKIAKEVVQLCPEG